MQLTRCLLALGLVCALACAADGETTYTAQVMAPPATAAPARASASAAEEPSPLPQADVEAALTEITEARTWREDEGRAAAAFGRWGRTMARLTAAEQHDEADRIADAIVDLRQSWDASVLPAGRFDAFTRDQLSVRGVRLSVAQYFEPVLRYAGDDRITKSLRFSAYHKDRVVRRYYLEHDSAHALFTLSRVDVHGHRTLVVFGDEMPSYRLARAAVIADLYAAREPPG